MRAFRRSQIALVMAGPFRLPIYLVSLSHGDSCAPLVPIVSSGVLFVLGAEIITGKFTLPRQTLGYDDSNTHCC